MTKDDIKTYLETHVREMKENLRKHIVAGELEAAEIVKEAIGMHENGIERLKDEISKSRS